MPEIELVDLDSVEIVTEIEHAFHIKIGNAEAAECWIVGDLFALMAQKVPTVDRSASSCPAALAFWRLRSALREMVPNRRISPATPLAELMPVSRRRAWWRRLERATGMVLPATRPPPAAGWSSWLPQAIGVMAFGIALACGARGWSVLVGGAAALVFVKARRRSDVLGMGAGATVGDLAKITAALNAGLLAQRSGSMRRAEAWTALEGVIRNLTYYSGPIETRTRFRCV
jgi:hypothetical protein